MVSGYVEMYKHILGDVSLIVPSLALRVWRFGIWLQFGAQSRKFKSYGLLLGAPIESQGRGSRKISWHALLACSSALREEIEISDLRGLWPGGSARAITSFRLSHLLKLRGLQSVGGQD